MYSLCNNIKFDYYYLKTRDMQVWLVSCLLDSNRNSTREFVLVSGNWFVDELPYPLLPRDVGQYPALSFVLDLILLLGFLMHIRTYSLIDLL